MEKPNSDDLPFTGERYLPEVPGQLELEHFHRYILASRLVAGKRVLDIASGEGYGSNVLADVAAAVIGIDVSADAINHAKRRYSKNNLIFQTGDAASIPLPTASIDVVVSFETIEHHDRHQEMLAEVKRVLIPGGLFIISSPNKLNYTVIPEYFNPYHVKELFREEFEALLKSYFSNVQLFGQRVVYGSLIVPEEMSQTAFSGYLKNDEVLQDTGYLLNPVYDIAFASDLPLPKADLSFYEQMQGKQDGATYLTHELMKHYNRVLALDQTRKEHETKVANLTELGHRQDRQIVELERQISDWSIATSNLNVDVDSRDRRIRDLETTLHSIYASFSWRLLGGIWWISRQQRRAGHAFTLLPGAINKAGGVLPLARTVLRAWYRGGFTAVKAAATRQAEMVAAEEAVKNDTDLQPVPEGPEILFVSHEASRTGAPIFLLDLIRIVKKELNIRCTIVLCAGGDLEAEFRELGDVYVLASRHHVDVMTMRAITRRDIRLVYANTITNGLVQQQLRVLNRPILCHVHELEFSIERHFGPENLQRVLESTDHFLAGSGVVRRYLVNKQHVPKDKVSIGYPFIDTANNEARAKMAQAPLAMPDDAVIVVACGTISWRKGTDIFVQLANRVLKEQGRRVEFVWIGGPLTHGEYPNLRYDAEQLGITDHLHFPGEVSDHIRYLSQCDIFVLTSREDPFPLVVLDAASLGCPVVCFDRAGGAPEFVENDAGRVVDYLDVEKMAKAVSELIDDAPLRRKLGDRAREKVRQRHDRGVVGAQAVEVIRSHLFQEKSIGS